MRTLAAIALAIFLSFSSLEARCENGHGNSSSNGNGNGNGAYAFGADARAALGAYRGMVEEHAEGILQSLHLIAASEEARSGAEERFKPLLTQLAQDIQTESTVWFAFPDGNYYATETEGMTDQNLKDRHYFEPLMAGKEVFGDLVISKSTGHRSVILAVPVHSNGKVVGGVGVSLRVTLLSKLVDQHLRLSSNSYFFALERDTRIVIHQKADRLFMTPSDVGDEAVGEQFKQALQQNSGTLEYTLQGQRMSAIYELSPKLGWYFFIAKEG